MKNTFYIDADYLVYTASLLSEKVIKWDESLHTLHSELGEARDIFYKEVKKLCDFLSIDRRDMTFCFSSPGSRYWRHRVMPSYKGNRLKKEVGERKPICYTPLLDDLLSTLPCLRYRGLEADDVLGINAHKAVMVSPDKDMLTVPGDVFNPLKPERGVVTVTQEEADYAHLSQVLSGDTVDGYAGCPGFGPKTTAKLLDPLRGSGKAMWAAILKAYEKKGLDEADALMNAQVAYILRPGDYSDAGEINIWAPDRLTS